MKRREPIEEAGFDLLLARDLASLWRQRFFSDPVSAADLLDDPAVRIALVRAAAATNPGARYGDMARYEEERIRDFLSWAAENGFPRWGRPDASLVAVDGGLRVCLADLPDPDPEPFDPDRFWMVLELVAA